MTLIDANAEAALIATQNDNFRKAIFDPEIAASNRKEGVEGELRVTRDVAGRTHDFIQSAFMNVATFNDFTIDNDPHQDHSFGAFYLDGTQLFWKIDLYDLNYEYGSNRPADPSVTRRALTIMTSSEY
jgi:hypothetical protein